ncbi:complement factor H-related protein 1-like isoform X4 [Eleutherodactylus coqui]|uniref:complement factor H-related protein 1-like isoform X4 n=1 Tax=Eleutherodactylus coqui TaxID=57060 RepID=UPI0034623642
MPSLGLIIGLVSLTLCCFAQTTSDKAKCEKPPEIENTTLLGNWDEETYPQNHIANYSCHPGYVMKGRIRMTCSEGKWVMLRNGQCKNETQSHKVESGQAGPSTPRRTRQATPPPEATLEEPPERLCPNPGETPFVTFELKNELQFVFGAVVEYSCVEGYQMVSKHRTRTCAVDGWTNTIPHCEARLCPPVKDDSVRVISNVGDDEFTFGQAINFKCKNPKDSLKGPSMIYCTEDGTWNMAPPTCKVSCTVQQNDMREHNVQLKNNRGLNYRDNEDVRFECISGYNITDPAKLMIKCNDGILKYPTCHKIANTSCGKPPLIEYGEIMTSMRNYYNSGSSVIYKCPYLYKLHGPGVVRCRGGVWNKPPVCLAPCITNAKKMSENRIMVMWKKCNKNLCERNKQKRKCAEKCFVKHNDTIQFACLPGYIISDPTDLISKCQRGNLPYPRCFKGK